MTMLGGLITAVIAAMAFSCAVGRSVPRTILITPDNIDQLATRMSSTIEIDDRAFHFRAGASGEVLLVVPLVGPGELSADALIQITVGLDTTRMNSGTTDEDPHVGITDGTNKNIFWIADKINYPNPACIPASGSHDDKRVPSSTLVSDQVTLLFQPYTKYGACYTAQLGGYVNTARFNQQVKVNAAISLQVERQHTSEQYSYHYIKVEIVP